MINIIVEPALLLGGIFAIVTLISNLTPKNEYVTCSFSNDSNFPLEAKQPEGGGGLAIQP